MNKQRLHIIGITAIIVCIICFLLIYIRFSPKPDPNGQKAYTLEDGGAVLLTVAVVEPKAGPDAIYNNKGIEPTTEVKLTSGNDLNLDLLSAEQDNQLQAALNLLLA